MRLLLSVILYASCALAAENPEILFCLFERTGVFYDQLYQDSPQSLNCGNTTFCQKITANFISVGDKSTHIVLKGCDGIEIPKVFYGPECKKEGCSEICEGGEKYQLCCCKGDKCNSSPALTIFPLLNISLIFILTR